MQVLLRTRYIASAKILSVIAARAHRGLRILRFVMWVSGVVVKRQETVRLS